MTVRREDLITILMDWRDSRRSPESVITEARQLWEAGAAPPEDDPVASDVLFMVAMAANEGLTHEDIPALLEFLGTPPGSEQAGLNNLGDYILSLDPGSRDPTANSEYYGSAAALQMDPFTYIRDPDLRRLYRARVEDPESVWLELADLFTTPSESSEREHAAIGLLEDLIYWHAETFIDRIEALATDSGVMRDRVAGAYVGGIGESPAVIRFWKLQESIHREPGPTR